MGGQIGKQKLDKILIKQRWMIIDHAHEYYKHERERLKVPKAYWWWYLDELDSHNRATESPKR